MSIFVTPGAYPRWRLTLPPGRPFACTWPLQFGQWAAKYEVGEVLATTDTEQIPARVWPPDLKCRSRMHYYLADRQARARFPGSRALMVDEDGWITETTTSNIVLYKDKTGLVMPPAEKVLPGISLAVLVELADQLDIRHAQRATSTPADVSAASEAFLTSTSVCMLPVVRFNGQPMVPASPARFSVGCWGPGASWSGSTSQLRRLGSPGERRTALTRR